MPVNKPPVIRDQDRIDFRLTGEAEYQIPFTFIEALALFIRRVRTEAQLTDVIRGPIATNRLPLTFHFSLLNSHLSLPTVA